MKILLYELQSGNGPLHLEETLSNLGLGEFGESRTVNIELHPQVHGDDLFLNGTVHANLDLPCDRCLTTTQQTIEAKLALWLLAEERPDLDPDEQELVLVQPGQREVDLSGLVAESILLEKPSKVLCQADCRGFCSNCGADLNRGHCDCPQNEMDGRWSDLIEIKQKLEGK
ncbi:MAG: DUF177 domain-containing protein [Candidatus Neomarinimicrobiota bacterium]